MTKNELKQTVSDEIFRRRTEKGISQPLLARMLDVSSSNVQRWEGREVLPSLVMLCRMADLLECTTDDLLGRHRENEKCVSGEAETGTGRSDAHRGAGDPTV